jgi:hypothetical protein
MIRYARAKRIGGLLGLKSPQIFGWDCKVYAIETAFKREGYGWFTTLKKPKLTQVHGNIRKQGALDHLNWIEEQWFRIF